MHRAIYTTWCIFCSILPSHGYAADTMQLLEENLAYMLQRDQVLAHNIAHGDTPEYKPQDLKRHPRSNNVREESMSTTHPMHISDNVNSGYEVYNSPVFELKPNGNAVTLEHEMMKKGENASQIHATSNAYNKVRAMLRTALIGEK